MIENKFGSSEFIPIFVLSKPNDMNVLIVKANEPIISEHYPKAKFVESTKNTSMFKLSEKAFIKLRDSLREKGYNPYSLMSW